MKGCSIDPDPDVTEARMECGLVRGHAYSITKVLNAKIETPQVSGIITHNVLGSISSINKIVVVP